MRIRLIGGLAAVMALGACLVPEVSLDGKKCDADNPCIAGQICVASVCQQPAGSTGTSSSTTSTGSTGSGSSSGSSGASTGGE